MHGKINIGDKAFPKLNRYTMKSFLNLISIVYILTSSGISRGGHVLWLYRIRVLLTQVVDGFWIP